MSTTSEQIRPPHQSRHPRRRCTRTHIWPNEIAFEKLLKDHWPTLHRLGLVTDQPSQCFRGEEQEGGPLYIEIFDWLDGAVRRAHEHPEVMAIWEPMDQLCEARHGKPNMEFPHLAAFHA